MNLRVLTATLYLYAIWWVVFAVAWYFRDSQYSWLYGGVGLGVALTLSILTYFIGKRKVWAWWVVTILVGFLILISIFDEIGWADVIYLVFSIAVLVILLKGRLLKSE